MSAFSERLTMCVEKSGLSKNTLIDTCKVNRSTFFQCLNGKRLPTDELFESMVHALQLAPGEEEQLRKCYHIAQIGEDIYQSRECARKCLETLSALSGDLMPHIHQFKGESMLTAARVPLQGENQVFQELCNLVQAEMFLEEPQIDLFLPQENDPFFEYLKMLYHGSEKKNVRLRQLVQFSKKKGEKARDSLTFFRSILFFLVSNCTGYEAYYYYNEADFADAVGVLYPYSVITSTGALLLNERMDRGLFSSTPEILTACRNQFEEAKGKAKPFYTPFRGYQEISNFYLDRWEIGYERYRYFTTPGFGQYFTSDIMEKYCKAGMEQVFCQHFGAMTQGRAYTSFCTERGLMDFAQIGLVGEYPTGLIPPLEPEDRVRLLERMLYRPLENTRLYLLDEKRMSVSGEFIFSMDKGRQIIAYRKAMPRLQMYFFTEQNLLDAFLDYFEALTESTFVLPQSELDRVLRQAIACAKACCRHTQELEPAGTVGV